MRSIAEIDADIAQIQKELVDVRGTETEVYSRIVGYYRSVRNWNRGKRDEYNHRKQFVYKDGCKQCDKDTAVFDVCEDKSPLAAEQKPGTPSNCRFVYEFFGKPTCPNCPPVKKYLESLSLKGRCVSVDTEEGLNRAAQMGVLAAPTVILFYENGEEAGRANTVAELSVMLNPAAEHVA